MRPALALALLATATLLGASPAPCLRAEGAAAETRLYELGGLAGAPRPVARRLLDSEVREALDEPATPPLSPAGSLEDLQEWLRTQSGRTAWEGPGGSWLRAQGPRAVLAHAPPPTLAQLGATLAGAEQAWLRPLRLDLLAVRLAPEAASLRAGQPADAAAAEALARAAEQGTGLRAGLSLLLLPGRSATAFAGQQGAYVTDYDVEVAQRSSASDPYVSALRTGLSVQATLWPGLRAGELRLELDARLAELLRVEPGTAGDQRPLELPQVASTQVVASATLQDRAWTVLPGAAPRGEATHVLLLARASRASDWPEGVPAGHLLAAPAAGTAEAALEQRAFPAHALVRSPASRRAPDLALLSSGEGQPPLTDLDAPGVPSALGAEELTSLLRTLLPPEAWGARGGSADLRLSTLEARAPAPTLEAIGGLLRTLEEGLAPAYEVEARLVDLPANSPVLAGLLLSPEAEAALSRALGAGEATALEQLRVQARAAQRNHVSALEQRSYVQDLDIEIAQETSIVDPVVGTLATGCVLEVEPLPCAGPGWVRTSLVLQRSVLAQALRTVRTAAGDLQCPDLRQHEVRLDLALPLGRSALAATFTGAQGRRVALLVSVRRA
ncbi:MAG: hypothetical protein ACKOSS_03765 [Planctomycetia bacterium]